MMETRYPVRLSYAARAISVGVQMHSRLWVSGDWDALTLWLLWHAFLSVWTIIFIFPTNCFLRVGAAIEQRNRVDHRRGAKKRTGYVIVARDKLCTNNYTCKCVETYAKYDVKMCHWFWSSSIQTGLFYRFSISEHTLWINLNCTMFIYFMLLVSYCIHLVYLITYRSFRLISIINYNTS